MTAIYLIPAIWSKDSSSMANNGAEVAKEWFFRRSLAGAGASRYG
jgi:hypothetical protein